MLYPNEKKGKSEKSPKLIQEFREAIEYAELHDMGFEGPKFMWSNGKENEDCVWK